MSFTDYWMYPVSLFASIFPYSKQNITYTCCLCEVHSVLKEKELPVQATVQLQCAHGHSNFFFYHRNYLVASARLASQCQLLEICRCILFLFVEIRSFLFSKSTRGGVLDTEVKKILINCSYRVGLQYLTAGTVQNHKTDLENLFTTIIESDHDQDPETVCSVRGYLALSRDLILTYSLQCFQPYFHTQTVCSALLSQKVVTFFLH